MALVEPIVNGMKVHMIIRKLGFDHSHKIEEQGLVGVFSSHRGRI